MPENTMLLQVESLPELMRSQLPHLKEEVQHVAPDAELLAVRRVIITGCGDSYFAGLATEMTFESIAGMPVEVYPAMQGARFGLPYQPLEAPGSLLVAAVSVSGTVARTAEAAQIARSRGALTIGLTGDPGSRLGSSAERVLNCAMPPFVNSPGVRSYQMSLMALYLLVLRVAEVNERITAPQAAEYLSEIEAAAGVLERTIAAIKEPVKALAYRLEGQATVEFIGHGPNYASALFSAAKVIEAAGLNATGQDTEEWAHLQYFIRHDPATPLFLISPGDRGHNRVAELIEPARRVGRTLVAVTPEGDSLVAQQADLHLPVMGQVNPLFTPLVYSAAGTLYAAYLAEATGQAYFRRETARFLSGDNAIRSSRILGLEELQD